jgi:hypothetical protein
MATLEARVARIEELLGEVFRPGGTLAIRDEAGEAAALIVGDAHGDIGSVLMSVGLSIKEPSDDSRIVVTSAGIGVKDDRDVLRILITEQGILFLDETGTPQSLIAEDGMHVVGDAEHGGNK